MHVRRISYCWMIAACAAGIMILSAAGLHAQGTALVFGTITDSATGRPIGGATVELWRDDGSASEAMRAMPADYEGRFRFEDVPPGAYRLVIRTIGYQRLVRSITLAAGDRRNLSFSLTPQAIELEETVIVADRIIGETSVSDVTLKQADLGAAHGLTEDPVRAVSRLPGIGGVNDLFAPSQIYVRGGAPEENLFLLDNVQLFWPWYFGGQKSVYNGDVIEKVEMLTGGFPATYGNHLSSVLNVVTREGSMDRFRGELSLGFYNSQATVEGPIVEDRLSVLASVRRTYLDLFLDETAEFPVPYFGDITYKATYKADDGNKILLSGLSSDEGLDFITADPEPGLPNKLETSGNIHAQSLQWQSVVSDNIYSKLSLMHAVSGSDFIVGETINAEIEGRNLGVREDLSLFLGNGKTIQAGFEAYHNTFSLVGNFPLDPSYTDPNDTTVELRDYNVDAVTRRGGAYLLYDGSIIDRLGVNAGLRMDYLDMNEQVDISPRIALQYRIGPQTEVRAAYGHYYQSPSPEALQQQADLVSNRAVHYIAGLRHRFSSDLSGWVEAYYKDYDRLTIYDSLLNYSSNGTGTAKGIEVFLRKERGALRGWISYALSKAERRSPLRDQVYDFDYDQRHILNVVGEYDFGSDHPQYLPRIISAQFQLADGTPYTPVVGAMQTPSGWQPVEGEINSSRNPLYHNLNLHLEWVYEISDVVTMRSYVEAWNVLNRKNVLGRTYRYGPEYENNVRVQPYYTTPLLVAGGFSVSFF